MTIKYVNDGELISGYETPEGIKTAGVFLSAGDEK